MRSTRRVPPGLEDTRRDTGLDYTVDGVKHVCDHQALLVDLSVPTSARLCSVMYRSCDRGG